MSRPRSRPQMDRLAFPLDARQVEALDNMLEELFKAQRKALPTTAAVVAADPRIVTLGIVIDGGGAALTTGIKGDLFIPYACTIIDVTMLADQSGSVVVDVWKKAYSSYPPTVTETITASALPTITTALKSQNTTLVGWTTALAAEDTLRFNVNSCTSITRLTLAMRVSVTP